MWECLCVLMWKSPSTWATCCLDLFSHLTDLWLNPDVPLTDLCLTLNLLITDPNWLVPRDSRANMSSWFVYFVNCNNWIWTNQSDASECCHGSIVTSFNWLVSRLRLTLNRLRTSHNWFAPRLRLALNWLLTSSNWLVPQLRLFDTWLNANSLIIYLASWLGLPLNCLVKVLHEKKYIKNKTDYIQKNNDSLIINAEKKVHVWLNCRFLSAVPLPHRHSMSDRVSLNEPFMIKEQQQPCDGVLCSRGHTEAESMDLIKIPKLSS